MKYFLPLISIFLVLAVVGGAAFFFGEKSMPNNSILPTPTVGATKNTNPASNISQENPADQAPQATIQAGGVLVFSAYSLKAPSDWTSQRQQETNMDILTVTKANYKITISQIAADGGGCIFSGDAPAQMAQHFSIFSEILNPNGYTFRRGTNDDSKGNWTVCQKNTSDGSFGFPTSFGNIAISTPIIADATTMAEIDTILTSLNKQ